MPAVICSFVTHSNGWINHLLSHIHTGCAVAAQNKKHSCDQHKFGTVLTRETDYCAIAQLRCTKNCQLLSMHFLLGSICACRSTACRDRPPQLPGDSGLRSPQKRSRSQQRERRQRVGPGLLDERGHCPECWMLRHTCVLISHQAIRDHGWHVHVIGHIASPSCH